MAVDEMVGSELRWTWYAKSGVQMVLRELGKRPILFDKKYKESYGGY